MTRTIGSRSGKGQVFVMAAVIFASLIFLVYSSSVGSDIEPKKDTTKKFFESGLKESPAAFNEGLEDNHSIDSVKRELYSFDRFLERATEEKGIDFGVSQLAVLPERGKAIFINYRTSSEKLRMKVNGTWTNSSVSKRQNVEDSFSQGSTEVRLKLPDRNFDTSFNASTPRVLTLMRMETGGQTWVNSRTD